MLILKDKIRHITKGYEPYVFWVSCALFAVSLISSGQALAQTATNGSWQLVENAQIEQSSRYTKRGVGYYTYNSILLADDFPLGGPLRIVITNSSHDVISPDGTNTDGNPYFNVTAVDEVKQIYFQVARKAFSYQAQLQQYVEESNAIEFSYDFNTDEIQTENNNWEGWVYPTRNRGVVTFEEAMGEDGSAVYVFEDTSTNVNIVQHGIRFNNRTNQANINPWTTLLEGAHGKTLNSVSLWVRVEKAVPGNVTIRHNLIPFPVIDDTRGPTVNAGIALGPQYEMVVPESYNGQWVQVEFIDTNTGEKQFTIPDTWQHFDGDSDYQVYPQFLFGGLDVGDKVYVDNYRISENLLENPCCDPTDGDAGSGGGNNGGGTPPVDEPDYNLGDVLTFNYTFDENNIAASQGTQGWIYSVIDRGTMQFEDDAGRNGSALSYEDISQNINPEQNGIYLQQWSSNPFTARFSNNGHIINSVKLWVKTELVTEKDIQIIHYLLPYGLVDGNKSVNYPAAVAAAPRLVGTIPAGSSDWVEIDFVIEGTDGIDFVIPPTWYHATGDELQIYPEFKFANTEVGDKIYLDDYQAMSTVGAAQPIPTDFSFVYDFEDATHSQSNGWGFISAGFSGIAVEETSGFGDSRAVSFTDINDGTIIGNHSLIWHKFNNTSPWSQALAGANVGAEVQSITLRVKVEKAAGNSDSGDLTIKHNLLPWNITLDGGKTGKVAAAQEITADYVATVSADSFGEWVEISFVDANTGSSSFVIPDLWQLPDGSQIVSVLPAFFFGGLETGDKVIIDDYVLAGDKANARAPISDAPVFDYGLHDGSGTFTNVGRPAPLPVVDTNFYTASASSGVEKDAVVDYSVNNTDTLDDTAALQTALDEISTVLGGGKLTIPAGDYYVRSLHLRSNVHIEVDEGATFYMVTAGSFNEFMFEMGQGQDTAVNFSLVGLGEGFTVDLTNAPNIRTAVFRMGDIDNFRIANVNINDGKTIFASFLIGVVVRNNDLYWPKNGIIENIYQTNSLFGYGVIQTYAADNILFRNLHSEGGITLRMETDHLAMKDFNKGGVRDIFAENISGEDCLAPVMFGPHFQENGSVQVNGVTSDSCGFAVRVDEGFVELFSPAGASFTRNEWRDEVNATYDDGCAALVYARGNNQWAARIKPTQTCLDAAHSATGLKPGWFEESFVYNVTSNYGTEADLKLEHLYYIPATDKLCIAATDQWASRGQIFIGDSVASVYNTQEAGVDYNFNINIYNLQHNGFPGLHYELVDGHSATLSPTINNFATATALPDCSDERWD